MNNLTTPRNDHTLPINLKDIPAQIASVLAHEIRNPLTTIKLAVGMLEFHSKTDEAKVFLDIIVRGTMQIDILITELLKDHHIEEEHAEKHSIHGLIDEALSMAGDRIRLKNILVNLEYAAQDCNIALNKPEMKIALTNIIINAIDAMESDGGELKVVTKADIDQCILIIEDNGCGISSENLKSIFKPYFTNKPGGMGLGLATTQDILRLNHVGVNVESVENEGTRFILSFNKNLAVTLNPEKAKANLKCGQ